MSRIMSQKQNTSKCYISKAFISTNSIETQVNVMCAEIIILHQLWGVPAS